MKGFKKAVAAGVGAVGTGMLTVAATLTASDTSLDVKTGIVSGLVILGGGLATFGATYMATNEIE